jgi:hypothetical protein
MRLKFSMLLMGLSLASSSTAYAQVVFDNMSGHSLLRGPGAYSIYNNGVGGTLNPTFRFIPSGIPGGLVLSSFVVALGNGPITGVHNFDLTLWTSGSVYETHSPNWTQLGSWTGQTDGVFDGQNDAIVPTTPVSLVNGNFYYLEASVRASEGVDNNNNQYLDWGYVQDSSGPFWEVPGDPQGGLTVQGAMKVFVGPAAASTPEPGSIALLTGLGISGGVFILRRRRSSLA